jgi:hypothetical protein
MSQLVITDLNFFEAVFSENICLRGGTGISASGRLTPRIAVAADTDLDTRSATDYNVTGNLLSGFGVGLLALGSAAGAAASAASIGGLADASANARA